MRCRFVCQHGRIKQGDLTDPDYFDFISFAQYASVAEAMRNGRDIFEEKVGAEGEKRTVQRNPDYADNSLLPAEHSRRVGDKMLVSTTVSSINARCKCLRKMLKHGRDLDVQCPVHTIAYPTHSMRE